LKEAIQGVLGKQVTLVDSAFETAKALHQLLETQDLFTQNKGPGSQRFFTTDSPEKFNKHASLFLGHDKAQAEFTNLGIE
jgi:glutamate racemase